MLFNIKKKFFGNHLPTPNQQLSTQQHIYISIFNTDFLQNLTEIPWEIPLLSTLGSITCIVPSSKKKQIYTLRTENGEALTSCSVSLKNASKRSIQKIDTVNRMKQNICIRLTCLSQAIQAGNSTTSPLGQKEGYLSERAPNKLGYLTFSTRPRMPGAMKSNAGSRLNLVLPI